MRHSVVVRGAPGIGRTIVGALLVVVGCGGSPAAQESSDVAAPSEAPTEPERAAAAPVVKEREPVASPKAPEEFVGKHVLVELGTPLLVAAKADAAQIVMRKRGEYDVRARAFEVVGHENGFLALVRAKPEARCDDGLPELDPYDPKLYVAPEQVARVLAREAAKTFADGTSVSLRPGVHVGEGERVDAGGLALAFAVDPRDVATAFTPTMAKPPEGLPTRVGHDRVLRYGEHEIADARALFRDVRGALALSQTFDDTDEIVEVLNACATVRARAVPGDVEAIPDPRLAATRSAAFAGILGSSGESIVAAGAKLSWADGTPGRDLAAELRFPLGASAKTSKGNKGKKCFLVDAPDARVEPFEVCFAKRYVTTHDPFASMMGVGAFGELSAIDSGLSGIEGGLLGSEIGEMYGTGGLGMRGSGGGGGSADLGGIGEFGGGGSGGAIGGLGTRGGGGSAVPTTPDVRITSGSVFADGTLSEGAVKSKIGASKSGIEYCAESVSPVATGTLSITLTVAADGKPSAVNVSGISEIEDCVQRSIERWKLAKSDGTTTVSFELTIALEGS